MFVVGVNSSRLIQIAGSANTRGGNKAKKKKKKLENLGL